MKELQVSSNEGPRPFSRGDNSGYIHQASLKISFGTTGPISTKLGTKHPMEKRTQAIANKDDLFLKKEMIGFSSSNQRYDIFIALLNFVLLCLLI